MYIFNHPSIFTIFIHIYSGKFTFLLISKFLLCTCFLCSSLYPKMNTYRGFSLSLLLFLFIINAIGKSSCPVSNSPSRTVVVNNHRSLNLSFALSASAASSTSIGKQTFHTSVSLSKSDSQRHALFLISLLTLSLNVELNPGPTFKYPCGACSRPCKKNQLAICCDYCDLWYHKKCLDMNSKVYEALENHCSYSWICCQCGLPNFSSSLFDSFSAPIENNKFFPIKNLNDHTPPLDTNYSRSPPFRPPRASSPKKTPSTTIKDKSNLPPPQFRAKSCIKNLVINFRSYIGKKHFFNSLLDSISGVDFIFGTETWLTSNIKNPELNLEITQNTLI